MIDLQTPHAAITWPHDVTTLCIDIGGSGLKAAVVDPAGSLLSARVRVNTPYPCPPPRLIQALTELIAPLPHAQRATVGFPGLVRDGHVLHIPSLSRATYDGATDAELRQLWLGYPLGPDIAHALAMPTKLLNDADVSGCAVVHGEGVEFVLTLGTGVGTALFENGHLLPHLELSHGPFTRTMSTDTALGNVQRKGLPREEWRERVRTAIANFDAMIYFDRIYVGGGNAKKLEPADVGPKGVIVPNSSGIIGGVRAWELAN